jgi:hypothetical protein
MPDIPEPEQSENQRHPADTLNDGSPHKFFLFIPAFVVHFAIVAWGASFIGSWLRRALMLPWFLSSSAWILLLLNYVVALTMGLAIGRRLDRWFLGTGKFLWLPALLWFVYGLFESGRRASAGDYLANFYLLAFASLPLVSVLGYAAGLWARSSALPEEEKWLQDRQEQAARRRNDFKVGLVKVWRAGRSIDYPIEEREETTDSSLRSE